MHDFVCIIQINDYLCIPKLIDQDNMAHHLSAKKRIRQTESKRVKNKYFARTARTAVKKLRETTEKEAATEQYSEVVSMLDKLAKNNVIHKNKASNLKSKLAKHVNSL